MAGMQEKASTTTPVHPDEVLMDLRLGEAVTDLRLSLAAAAATGRTRDRLWREVMTRLTPVIRKAARSAGAESESYMWELAVLYHDSAVDRAGGIEHYGKWAKANVARGIADRAENLRSGRAPQAKVGADARRIVRALDLCSGDVEAARAQLLAGGFTGDVSDSAIADAIALQAVVEPASLSPRDGDDDDWTSRLEAQAVAPRRTVPLSARGYALMKEKLGLTDAELTVLTAEYGFDGADPVAGARAISEEIGLDYDLARNAQTTLKRKLRKAGADVVRDAMTAAREVAGTPVRRTIAAQRQAELAMLLAPVAPAVEVTPVTEVEAPAEVKIVHATPMPAASVSESVIAPEADAILTANSQLNAQDDAPFAAGYLAEAKTEELSGAGQVHTDDQPADDSKHLAQRQRIIHLPHGRWRPPPPGALVTVITHYATPEARAARLAYLRTPEGKADLDRRALRMVDRIITLSRKA